MVLVQRSYLDDETLLGLVGPGLPVPIRLMHVYAFMNFQTTLNFISAVLSAFNVAYKAFGIPINCYS